MPLTISTKFTLLLIPLLLLSSCSIDGNDEKKNIYPTNTSISEVAKKAGITLKQEVNSISLIYNGNALIGWFYTEDKNPPIPVFPSGLYCSEITESLNILSGSTLGEIWSKMTYEGKRDCIKESTLKNIYVDMTGSSSAIVSGIITYPNEKFIIDINTSKITQVRQPHP